MLTRSVSRAEYDSSKADFIATLRSLMAAKNLSVPQLADISRKRALAGETITSLSPANIYHYLTGVALPTPPKLAELANVLGCSPTELIPKALQARRRVKRRTNINVPDHYTIRVDPTADLAKGVLVVQATLPMDQAHTIAGVLSRKLSDLHALAQVPGMTQAELEEHKAAAAARDEANR